MGKKIIGVFCLIMMISCSTIFGNSLINIIYDSQGNKISLYDDHTWLMNDEGWNDAFNDSQVYGKYVIKEEGMQDFLKIGLITDGTYPGTDEWFDAIGLMGIAMNIYSAEDLLEGSSFYIEISKNQLKIVAESDPLDNIVFDRVEPSSSKIGFYIQDNTLYSLGENRKLIKIGGFKSPDNFEMNYSIFMDNEETIFAGYEKYSYITLEKE